MTWLYHNLPTWLIGLVIIGAFALVALLGLLFFQRTRWCRTG